MRAGQARWMPFDDVHAFNIMHCHFFHFFRRHDFRHVFHDTILCNLDHKFSEDWLAAAYGLELELPANTCPDVAAVLGVQGPRALFLLFRPLLASAAISILVWLSGWRWAGLQVG